MERRLRQHVSFNGFFDFDFASGTGVCDFGVGLFMDFDVGLFTDFDPSKEMGLVRPELRAELWLELRVEAADGIGIARGIAVTTEANADELARRARAHKGS